MATGATVRSSILWVGLSLLGVQQLATGVWALLAPSGFFTHVPTVDVVPPYNEHLVRDVGAALLAGTPVVAFAVRRRDVGLAVLALICLLLFAVPHAVFHLGHSGGALLDVGVVLSVVVPAALMVLALSLRKGEGR